MASGSANFWFGKRVLITGGDGFVAANLANDLLQQGAYVVLGVRHQRPISTMSLLGVIDRLPDLEYCDFSTFHQTQRLCDRHQIDTIFHLAASAIVSDAARAPMSTFENNIIPTLNILEAARIGSIPRVLIASSDKSYGDHADKDDPERLPYKENHALRGLDVYSASKVCADMIAQTYAYQFRMPVLVVRSCNIYGPGDLNFTRLIPKTILRLMGNKPPVINQGNDLVLREYIYVDDLVAAYRFLAEYMQEHLAKNPVPKSGRAPYGWSAYNVGSCGPSGDRSNVKNVRQVIQEIAKRMDKSHIQPQEVAKSENFIEIPDQYLDSSRLLALNFAPKISFAEGIDASIKWYKDRYDYLSRLGDKYLR